MADVVHVFRIPGKGDGFHIVRDANDVGWEWLSGPYATHSDALITAVSNCLRGKWYIGECTAGVLTLCDPQRVEPTGP